MFKLRSIKTKLAIFFGSLIFLICTGFGVTTYFASSNALTESIKESLTQLAYKSADVVQARVEAELNVLEAIAQQDVIKKDTSSLNEKLRILDEEVQRSGHYKMIIADLNGNSVDNKGVESNISDRDYFKKAKEGENAVSDPMVSKVDNSIIVAFAVPIRSGNTVKGVLIALRDGNALSDLTNDITFGKSGTAYMINSQGTTIAHKDQNLVMNMDNSFENVKNDPELKSLVELEKLMTEGELGAGEYKYNGVVKYMGFAPVKGRGWSLAITAPKSEVMEKLNSLLFNVVIVTVVLLIAGLALTLIIANQIAKPIKEASEYLNTVATGDLTVQVSQKLLKKKDETGVLANSINTMQKSIRNIISNVVNESASVSETLIKINEEMERLNKNIEGISATTEELSAGTEETASSTEEMNATSNEIERAIESIATKAQEGAVTVSNESRRTEEIKRNAEASRKEAVELYTKTKESLQKAIEQSKAVDQINELSEAILEITAQTNLLALNAAIEAARAGEAGKGFAVVAEEIRKLAEGSKSSVSRIQEVTKVILEAVNGMSSSSGEIMEFIDSKVLRDYDYLVESSEKSSSNAIKINDMVTDFSATSEEVLASVQNMVKAIEEIASAANEEAQGAADIAQEAMEVNHLSNIVVKLVESAKSRSDSLIKIVSSFKV